MEFSVKSGHPEKQRSACLVVGVFEPRRLSDIAEKLDKISDGYISNLLRRGDLEGKIGQVLLLHNVPGTLSDRVLLVGCGKERELGDAQYIKIIKTVVKTLNETGSMEAISFLPNLNIKGRDIHWKLMKAVQATHDELYEFTELKSKKSETRRPLRRMIFILPTRRDLTLGEKAIQEGLALSNGVNITKYLADLPANICTPTYLADKALEFEKKYSTISTAILEEKDMRALKMGALLAVTQGSHQPAKLITMEYRGAQKESKPIVLVGKGITFDTGGISLKNPQAIMGMKYDMCGAATIFGVFEAVAQLKLKINLIGVIPSCENMPGGQATRPDDIITTLSGLTVEIMNTDAEGRLILADALTYCERYHPEIVIDIATLTGACVTALGKHASGLMSNHNPLAHDLLNAGNTIDDRVWQLPLWDEYHEQLKSVFADIANVGGPEAGTITAGCFLSKFATKFHWAHLDIAGTAAHSSNPRRGASGRPVPLLVQYLIDYANSQSDKTKKKTK